MRKIAYITDTHIGQRVILEENGLTSTKMSYINEVNEHKENLQAILKDVARREISEIVFGGDIGSEESNQWFFETMNKYHFRVWVVLGNHDTFFEVSKYYKTGFTKGAEEMIYTQQDDYFKYIYLDSSSNSISNKQFLWLRDELATTKKLIIFIHHPILKVDTLIDHEGAALNDRDEIRELLHNIKNDVIIFCGHYHMNDEVKSKNIYQLLTAAASYQIEKQSETLAINRETFGYRIITIENSNLTSELILFKK